MRAAVNDLTAVCVDVFGLRAEFFAVKTEHIGDFVTRFVVNVINSAQGLEIVSFSLASL